MLKKPILTRETLARGGRHQPALLCAVGPMGCGTATQIVGEAGEGKDAVQQLVDD